VKHQLIIINTRSLRFIAFLLSVFQYIIVLFKYQKYKFARKVQSLLDYFWAKNSRQSALGVLTAVEKNRVILSADIDHQHRNVGRRNSTDPGGLTEGSRAQTGEFFFGLLRK